MNTNIESLYDFVLQQIAAECYLEGITPTDTAAIRRALRLGTNREGAPGSGNSDLNEGLPGYTRMTLQQVDEFLRNFSIVHQWSDNPTATLRPLVEGSAAFDQLNNQILANTGLSATLIQKKDPSGQPANEYTLAIRSTEFRSWGLGGDAERDKTGADMSGVALTGFALAQQAALERYYTWLRENALLPPGATLNVTGYSLGGHLATVFTEIHKNDANIRFGQAV